MPSAIAHIGKEAGVARILSADGLTHIGMGTLVDDCHIVTCAHVVNRALGAEFASEPKPEGTVKVVFPLIGKHPALEARPIAWHPMGGPAPLADIAVIELADPVPRECGRAVFAVIQGTPLDQDSLNVYGFAGGHPFGNHAATRFMGPAIDGLVQIDGGAPPGVFIEPGYSGGAVWDREHQVVIGMVVSKNTEQGQRVAYMIPSDILKRAWPELPIETRTLPPEFTLLWTGLAVCFFVLLLVHFLITQGASSTFVPSFSGDHPQLAAFYGMHVFALMAPVLYGMMHAYADNYSLHDWSWRVPPLLFIRTRMKSRYRKPLAATLLVALVALPLYAQGHFLRKFHNDGEVYIYAQTFGFAPGELSGCLEGTTLCRHADAGRYTLVTPTNDAAGGYWDNAYHYGHEQDGEDDSDTFFPVLQPVVIIVLTSLSVMLALLSIIRIFWGRGGGSRR